MLSTIVLVTPHQYVNFDPNNKGSHKSTNSQNSVNAHFMRPR